MSDLPPRNGSKKPRRDKIIATVAFLLGVGLVVGYGVKTVFFTEPVVELEPPATASVSSGQPDISITVSTSTKISLRYMLSVFRFWLMRAHMMAWFSIA